jgi:hypothetical protein
LEHNGFHNGSYIKVVTAGDSARGNRANVLIGEEMREADQAVHATVLKHFLTSPRYPGYLSKKEYQHLLEPNKEIYITSATSSNHWTYTLFQSYVRSMLDDTRRYFVCDLPYQLSISEGLLMREAVEDMMSEATFNQISFDMEMGGEWFGSDATGLFKFPVIAQSRRITHPMLPEEMVAGLGGAKQLKIAAKLPGEKRILSVDLALMGSKRHKNDASAIFINRMLPARGGRFTSNFVYTESCEGVRTSEQALRVRMLYDMYDCDYVAIDATGVGFGVADALVDEIPDPATGDVYPALSCCNNPDWADRCTDRHAPRAIWIVNPNARFNSEIALLLREGFANGQIRLLEAETEAEKHLEDIKGWKSLPTTEQFQYMLPYINTTLLIRELIGARFDTTGDLVRVTQGKGLRKDRYCSLAYNYYVATQLQVALRPRAKSDPGSVQLHYRAPAIHGKKRGDVFA